MKILEDTGGLFFLRDTPGVRLASSRSGNGFDRFGRKSRIISSPGRRRRATSRIREWTEHLGRCPHLRVSSRHLIIGTQDGQNAQKETATTLRCLRRFLLRHLRVLPLLRSILPISTVRDASLARDNPRVKQTKNLGSLRN